MTTITHPHSPATRATLIRLGSACVELRSRLADCRDTAKMPALNDAYERAQEKLTSFTDSIAKKEAHHG